ncbi:MAG: hypothetical protein JWN34_6251 [Bryobacterales bacterium]|jgi:hypothetical protein|nr:hypothetical protein [Bryobacterales bacterium]
MHARFSTGRVNAADPVTVALWIDSEVQIVPLANWYTVQVRSPTSTLKIRARPVFGAAM